MPENLSKASPYVIAGPFRNFEKLFGLILVIF